MTIPFLTFERISRTKEGLYSIRMALDTVDVIYREILTAMRNKKGQKETASRCSNVVQIESLISRKIT